MEKEAIKEPKINKTNKVLLVLVIILGIAVVALTTFICTTLLVKPESKTNEPEEKEVLAKEIKDIDTITDLAIKIDSILGYSDNEYHKSVTAGGYSYRYGVLKNTLSAEDKQWIVLNNAKWETLSGDAWKNTSLKTMIENDLTYMPQDQVFASHKQATAESINALSKKLFGEEITNPVETMGKCPMFIYDKTSKMYFYPEPRCGGTSSSIVKSYKSKFEEKYDEAYAYVSFAFLSPADEMVVDSEYIVYKDFDYSKDLYFGTLTHKNEYQRIGNSVLAGSFEVDSTNYQNFSEYKFTFKKDKNDNYYFVKVEQTK